MTEIQFQWRRLEGLTAKQLHSILAAREAVFVVEQACAYQEVDSYDLVSWHLVAWVEQEVAAYLRVVDPGHKFKEPSIGRVLTTEKFRGQGMGKILMTEALRHIAETFPQQGNRISAQKYLLDFYTSFGFKAVSEEYLEDGIPHIEMLRSA